MRQRITIIGITAFLVIMSVVGAAPKIFHATDSTAPNADKLSSSNTKNNYSATPPTQSENRSMVEYTAGYMLGECLAAGGCRVFIGTIRSIGNAEPESGVEPQKAIVYRNVDLAVDEWLASSSSEDPATIRLTSAAQPAFTKTSIGPWTSWQDADLKQGGKLLVGLWGEKAQREVWGGKPLEVALATSNSQALSGLRRIVEAHKRYEAAPEDFVNVTQQLEASFDNFLVGYIMVYAKKRVTTSNVDNVARVLSRLQKNQKVPEYVQNEISYQLLGNFRLLSAEPRRAATDALVGAGASDNPGVSGSAIEVMVRLSNDKNFDMRPFLTSERRSKLIANYQSIVAHRPDLSKHPNFENQLGTTTP
ncbi:MAG TPA: hypothetical protein VIF64_09585 [Pyrinomonadaceae bacterium]